MKILIYTTHRTGSTSLAQLLMTHYNCDYQRERFFKNKNFYNLINKIDNIIIKLTPSEVKYDDVRDVFDKCIVLVRDNIKEQAESRVYAERIKKLFVPYTIEDTFFEKYNSELEKMSDIIKSENELLKQCDNCLLLTYEELYYGDGIKKIEKYLNTHITLKLDNSKKYRNGKRTLL